ncbi:MAG: hypothetical protein J7K32_06305 [Deltaproteobacteria bacterium]|nr:hypothetical protein [Deltaproteobacteria bacterium]
MARLFNGVKGKNPGVVPCLAVPFMLLLSEDDQPKPQSPYGISKWEAEQALHEIADKTGLEVTDLTMIIRPDKRHAVVYDVLIGFKFVTLKDYGITGTQAEKFSENALSEIPRISQELDNGTKQVMEYGKKLESRHKNLRLVKFVVVALGFERVCFKKVDGIKSGSLLVKNIK